jgi:hypothetical protein
LRQSAAARWQIHSETRKANPMASVVYHNFQMGSARVSFSVVVWGSNPAAIDPSGKASR